MDLKERFLKYVSYDTQTSAVSGHHHTSFLQTFRK